MSVPTLWLQSTERTVFDDETERKREFAAERARQQAERMKQVRAHGGLTPAGLYRVQSCSVICCCCTVGSASTQKAAVPAARRASVAQLQAAAGRPARCCR
mgnify:CR=1 FL=1